MALRYRAHLGASKNLIESYFSSLEEDRVLAKYSAMVMLAHVKTLLSQGVIPKERGESVLKALVEVVKSKGEAFVQVDL